MQSSVGIIGQLQAPGSSPQAEGDTTFLKVTEALTRHKAQLPDEAREELAHLERLAAVGMFTAGIVHEIKNALVGIKTCVQLSADAEIAQVGGREVVRVESLVNLLLQYSSKPKRQFAPVRLNDLVRATVAVFEPTVAAKQIVLGMALAAHPDVVQGDQAQLHQAFLNLLLNALDATPLAGNISVSSDSGAGQIRILIRDSGAGIPAEDLDRIFDPFYTTKARGSGLGLGITRRIIRDHGGSIDVTSEPGRGATFALIFPPAM